MMVPTMRLTPLRLRLRLPVPGIQGGPLMHVIAAKAQCFYEALQPEFKEYQKQIIKNSKAMADRFKEKNVKIISNKTENHLMLVDVKTSFKVTGKEAEKLLDQINITCNKNSIPNETESFTTTSGIRIGTPAMTTRGFKEQEFIQVADLIIDTLQHYKRHIPQQIH